MMSFQVFGLFLVLTSGIFSLVALSKSKLLAIGALSVVVAIMFLGGFVVGVYQIPPEHSYEFQLSNGVLYTMITSFKKDENEVVIVKSGDDYRIITVKTMPPSRFTLIDGKPVAVGATVR